jgi:hypothetical protein
MDKSSHKVGAVFLMVGSALIFLFNALHPRPIDLSNPETRLRQIAASGIWQSDHVLMLLSFMVVLFGLAALARSLKKGSSAIWAYFALTSLLVATGMAAVILAVDGHSMKQVGIYLTNATPDQKTAALAAGIILEKVDDSLFITWIMLYFGVTALMFGIATAVSGIYPRFMGWLGVLIGLVGLYEGLTMFHAGADNIGVTFGAFDYLAFSIWSFVMGVLMWRRRDMITAEQF